MMSTQMRDSPSLERDDEWSKTIDDFLANAQPYDDGDSPIDLLTPDATSMDWDPSTFDLGVFPPIDGGQLTLDLDAFEPPTEASEVYPNDLIQDGPFLGGGPSTFDLHELPAEDGDLTMLKSDDVHHALTTLKVSSSDPPSAHAQIEDNQYWNGILEQLRFHSTDLKNGEPTSKLEDNPEFMALVASFEAIERRCEEVIVDSLPLGNTSSDLETVAALEAQPTTTDVTPRASTPDSDFGTVATQNAQPPTTDIPPPASTSGSDLVSIADLEDELPKSDATPPASISDRDFRTIADLEDDLAKSDATPPASSSGNDFGIVAELEDDLSILDETPPSSISGSDVGDIANLEDLPSMDATPSDSTSDSDLELEAGSPAMDVTPPASPRSGTPPPVLQRMDILPISRIAEADSEEEPLPVLDCYQSTSEAQMRRKRLAMQLSPEHQVVANTFRSAIAEGMDLDLEGIHFMGGVLEGVLGYAMEQFKDVFKGKRRCAKFLHACHLKLPDLDQGDDHLVKKVHDDQDAAEADIAEPDD